MKTLKLTEKQYMAVYAALGEYVSNMADADEHEALTGSERANYEGAQEVLAELDQDVAALADEPFGDELDPDLEGRN